MDKGTALVTFKTETGSVYEVNYEDKKIRRVTGTHDPTNHQGTDGEWKSFLRLSDEGGYLTIIWRIDQVNNESIVRRTITSNIVETNIKWQS